MKHLSIIIAATFILTACQVSHPVTGGSPSVISYMDLKDITVSAASSQSLDFDGDKKPDLLVGTLVTEDEISREVNLQYLAVSRTNSYLLLDNQEDADRNITPVMGAGAIIDAKPPETFHWVNVASVVLSRKITPENKTAHWDGSWKNANHNFLPFRIRKPNGNYYGWLEISMDTRSETMTLHRAAISTEPGRIIKTGI